MSSNKLTAEEQKLLDQYIAHQERMRVYNQRPEIKEKRRAYNSTRWSQMKKAREIAKELGIL